MPYLKYYAKEQSEYEKEHNHILTHIEVRKLIDECCMHYEMPSPRVLFKRMKGWLGLHRERTRTLIFSTHPRHDGRGTALLTVAHELGHHFDSLLNGKYHKGYNNFYAKKLYRKAHTKKHNECVKMVLKFFYRGTETSKYKNAPKLIVLSVDDGEHIHIIGRKKKNIRKFKSLTELFAE